MFVGLLRRRRHRGCARLGVLGHLLKFWVALGGSAILIGRTAWQDQRSFAGFDVFAVIVPPTSEKDDQESRERYSVISSGRAKGLAGQTCCGQVDDLYTRFCASFAKSGVPVDGAEVALIKGLHEDTRPSRTPLPNQLRLVRSGQTLSERGGGRFGAGW